jgi:sterol desaturase/sphingolipid hydroxylase (fatty acid hydroxylase superfamily)
VERRSPLIAARWVHIAAGVLMTVLFSILIAELAGYWLHRLLHSDKVRFLSRGHLIHHFLIYGPRQPMRTQAGYRDATDNRFSVGNIGLEWLVPSGIVLTICWGAMIGLHVPHAYQWLAVFSLLAWPIFMFSYLHDRMHEENFWMIHVPLLKSWFLKARRLHDIHHRSMNPEGRMATNFGIGFYWFDRFFGTIAQRHRPFNWSGYEIAKRRYLIEDGSDYCDEDPEEDSHWSTHKLN